MQAMQTIIRRLYKIMRLRKVIGIRLIFNRHTFLSFLKLLYKAIGIFTIKIIQDIQKVTEYENSISFCLLIAIVYDSGAAFV